MPLLITKWITVETICSYCHLYGYLIIIDYPFDCYIMLQFGIIVYRYFFIFFSYLYIKSFDHAMMENNKCYLNFIDNYFLIDINECEETTSGCQHICTNTDPNFTCTCRDGYTLNDDKKTCTISKQACLRRKNR